MWNNLFRTKNIDKIVSDAALEDSHGGGLKRVLTLKDLTFFGIAAIIGAGSFSSLGEAIYKGGPGVIVLFIICGIACAFTAMCYAEFASRIPVAGSAYTYAYASFGELFAWIIGWALIMEYSIGNIYVAYSWSDYFTSFLSRLGVHLPDYLTSSYMEVKKAIADGTTNANFVNAWNNAPNFLGTKFIVDLPAFVINILITVLVYIGVKESKNFSNAMVILKLAIVVLVILVGAQFIMTDNWMPANKEGVKAFMPNGFSGVMSAVSAVFFAYIGFDVISVMGEESKNPQRDIPRSMILSLVLCTVIYILLTLVLTGGLNYEQYKGVGDPLAKIFEANGNNWMQFIVSICAIIAITSVLLVFQLGQPRIWMSMSRDGLLPNKFQQIHPKFKTPKFATIMTGIVVGVPLLFTDRSFILDFTSIGTLFAFVLVCGGVLLLPKKEKVKGRFNMPYVNAQYLFPALLLGVFALIALQTNHFATITNFNFANIVAESKPETLQADLLVAKTYNISMLVFWVTCIILAVFAFLRKWSLIPILGLISCMYLLTGMAANNWKWFAIWFAIGLVVYALYGYKKSKLNTQK
jgi:basic amino acid/polyamine antiporter, APA family